MSKAFKFIVLALFIPTVALASSYKPIKTDSRIKTLVYNENEVYAISTQTGYQLNLAFGKKEEIQTISIGDNISWQVTPAGNMIFIKALANKVKTNMTVITSKRTYQFDLISTTNPRGTAYVIKFYYPSESRKKAPVKTVSARSNEMVLKPNPIQQKSFNFDYTLAGSKAVEPRKIFDDGSKTYFEFAGTQAPRIFFVDHNSGKEIPLRSYKQGKYLVVDKVSWQFSLRTGSEVTCVFNEKLKAWRGK